MPAMDKDWWKLENVEIEHEYRHVRDILLKGGDLFEWMNKIGTGVFTYLRWVSMLRSGARIQRRRFVISAP